MKKLLAFSPILVIFLFAFYVAGVASSGNGDDAITEAVKQKLVADSMLTGATIDVSTKDGIVTLKGKVIGSHEVVRALELARAVPGVKSANSELKVDTQMTNKDVKDRLNARDKSLEEQKDAKDKANPDDKSFLDDASVTAAVKGKLAEDHLASLYKIDVDTKDGVVTLTGTVKSDADAQQVVALAESVKGVKRVSSVLTVKP